MLGAGRLDHDVTRLLCDRLRAGVWLTISGILLFGAMDPVVHPDLLLPLWLIIAAELLMATIVLWRLRHPMTAGQAVGLGVLFVSFMCLSTAASGIVAGDAATTPVVLLVLTLGAATLLPWGMRPQLVVQIVATAAILWNVHAVLGLAHVASQPVAVVMGALAGVYAAHVSERYHHERRRAEQAEAELYARSHQAELAQAARLSTLGGMAAGLAHEINQPLAAIVSYARGCARRLRAGDLGPAAFTEVLEEISKQAMRASDVLRRIHDFVRLAEVPRARHALNALVHEAVGFAEVEARQRGVELELDLVVDGVAVFVDRVQIEQVILNLVRNGFEAMDRQEERGRRLTIRTWTEDGAAGVAVSDTGPGLPPAVLARLFDPFFTTKREGLGLGLSISRSIVEAHEGRLWAEPRAPRGATFLFVLPVAGVVSSAA